MGWSANTGAKRRLAVYKAPNGARDAVDSTATVAKLASSGILARLSVSENAWVRTYFCTMITLYGISNCDTVKKARKFLDDRAVDYRFHDFRKDGLTSKQVQTWLRQLDIDTLINKRSRTWKELSAKQRAAVETGDAVAVVVENPTLIKRPLMEISRGKTVGKPTVGFDQKQYLALFS